MSVQDYQQKIGQLEIFAEEAGRSLREIELGYFPVTNISLKAEEAIKTSKLLIAAGEEQPNVDIDSRLEWGVHGSPEMAIQQIEEFTNIGVKHFVLHIIPQKNTVNCLKLIAEEVITQLKYISNIQNNKH